jgi:hypothetical protein
LKSGFFRIALAGNEAGDFEIEKVAFLASGQKQCEALGYAPVPREIASRELQALSKLK